MPQLLNSTGLRLGETRADSELTHLLGTVVEFSNLDVSTRPATPVDARPVLAMLVKNASGGALLPNRLVKWVAASRGTQITGYSGVGESFAGAVDPFLPAAGVAANEAFWIILPTLHGTPVKLVSDGSGAISAGDKLQTAGSGKVKARTAESVIDAYVGCAEEAIAATDGLKGRVGIGSH